MKKAILCVLLTLAMSVNAFALEVPTDTVVQNLNGSQQAIKTYTIPPDQDPATLIEEPFELEGYLYTFANIVKTENPVEESKVHTEVVTVKTSKKDLSVVLENLEPTIEYDDGVFKGRLALDHTSIVTEAAGYTSKSYTVTETKTIGQLDRNDMSYVPATTVKDGRTLNLANVEWQVTGTDLVGETLMPSSYQAIATYSTKVSYSAATGYITTAEYVGEVTHEGIASITYVLTYLGEEIVPEPVAEGDGTTDMISNFGSFFTENWPFLLAGGGLIAAAICGGLLIHNRRAARQQEDDEELEEESEEQEVQNG